MSLPPGFIDELRTRVSLSSVVGRKVTWDMRKSNLGKGDMWAPCPFHQEKSASFHVDDRKGYYYCFGCHAKGDAISFVKETENLPFIEAVEVLAREAGMTMPARDPQAAQKSDRRTQLVQVMEEAVKWFRLQLKTSAASDPRAYLAKRRLSPDAQDRWEIGFAPDQRAALFQALTQKGIAPDLIVDAGLCARADDGSIYDRFRGRIIFPIRDGRGRAISLGGRSMDPNARAKYLNGPETDLFDKGRNLYNHAPAREAAGKGQPLIVAEGYMDVIALSEAGFKSTVAPLGTAVTEDQLRLMWRISDEPIIALDGDTAGTRAALRVIDLALPMLEAGKGLRFAMLPTGMDPDDLIKTEGIPAMQRVIDEAQPMVRVLWNRETKDKQFDSPERMAALRKRLRDAVTRVRDSDIRRYYVTGKQQAGASASAKASLLARSESFRAVEFMRETSILALCLRHPHVMAPFETDLETVELIFEGHSAILQTLLANYSSEDEQSLFARVCVVAGREVVEKLVASTHIVVMPAFKRSASNRVATSAVAEQLAKLKTDRSLRKEIEEAADDIEGLVDEGLTWRLSQASKARNEAQRVAVGESAEGEDRDALSKHLQEMIDKQVWIKKNH
jgi:DNA primase